ncbi:MAG: hypothetical protein AAGM22_11375 [Acidobacteriota bacterium]
MDQWDRTESASRPLQGFVFALALLLTAGVALAQPSFNQQINSPTIGPGSVATVTFTIDNSAGAGVRNLNFANALPSGLTVAVPAAVDSSCGGELAAASGGTTIVLTDGSVFPASQCQISVNVTASAPGTYTNVTGDLTSSVGNSGPSSATLTVDSAVPGFSKSFSPSAVFFNGRSTLTFTIDNSANPSQVIGIRFNDSLPQGMTVASPANASNTCTGGQLTATPGSSVIAYAPVGGGFDASVDANATCQISVDVIGGSVGELVNVSDDLTGQTISPFAFVTAGKASAALTVTFERLRLLKSFVNDPVLPGDSVTLEFTVLNLDRRDSVTGISFTDDLNATLPGLVATALPSSPCGAGSSLTGAGTLSFSGGSLAPESSCTFSAELQVPAGATAGTYVNTTSFITGNAAGTPVSGNPGTDSLAISAAPSLAKTFLQNPVGSGAVVTLEFTLTNTSPSFDATDITFTDSLGFLSGTSVAALPAAGYCGPSSTVFQIDSGGVQTLNFSGAQLAPGASCTFSIDLQTPTSAGGGSFTNTTSDVSATVNGETTFGAPASDTLGLVGGLSFLKEFIDGPVGPGDTATLRYTIAQGEEAVATAESIAFTDDLTAALAGLEAVGLPASGVCGGASQITGTTNLSFSGGALAPGETCVIDVSVVVPAGAAPGSYTGSTSNVMATVGGVNVVTDGAAGTLQIAGLELTLEVIDDPVIAGAEATVRYTIENLSPTLDATGLLFTQNFSQALAGLTAVGTPISDACGVGSQVTGGTFLIFVGGSVTAGSSCTFDVGLQVPAGAASGSYGLVTSNLTGTLDGTPVVFDTGAGTLEVSSELLGLSKAFTDGPVGPGGIVTLEFTVDNMADDTATGLSFTDDLDAALSGLASVSGAQSDICGAGSSLSGTSVLTFTGGSLAAGASCTFSVSVAVPLDATGGDEVTNITGEVSGTVGGLAVTGPPAIADLQLSALSFTKAFDGATVAGSSVQLTFTLENPSAGTVIDRIGFQDDLDAMLPGSQAIGLPIMDVCGEGSAIDGTSVLSLTGATLLPGGTCTFSVTVTTPSDAEPGDYLNVTEAPESNGIDLAVPATATLTLEEGCSVQDNFDDGVVDPAWTFEGVGNANQLSLAEEDGVLKLTADGATAFFGADNAGFLYREFTGDFRMEVTIDGNPMTTGGQYRKAGLMVRESLDKWDIRLIAQLVPFWENTDETHLQFVARESFGTPGRLPVARDVIGVPRVVRLAVERVGQVLAVEYSIDGGDTWIRPTTGLGGSILIDGLSDTILIGMDMVSNNISVTSTAHFDDFLICSPGEQPPGLPTPTAPVSGRGLVP